MDDESGIRALLLRLIADAGHETAETDSAERAVIRLDAAAVRSVVAEAMAWHWAQAPAGVKAGDDPITEWFQRSKGLGVVPDRSEPEGGDK